MSIRKHGVILGGLEPIDEGIDASSSRPVKNKAIARALEGKADLIGGKIPSSQLPDISGSGKIDAITVNGAEVPIVGKTANISIGSNDVGALPADSTGASLGLLIDPQTYVMTLQLKNNSGTVLDTKTVDLPLETMVVSASYENRTLTLTLQNGQTLDVDVSAMVSGLIPSSEKGANNGVATLDNTGKIPSSQVRTATAATPGTVKVRSAYGVKLNDQGVLEVIEAEEADIDGRGPISENKYISLKNLDYAVRSVVPLMSTIPHAATVWDLKDAASSTDRHICHYIHEPDEASTYKFPSSAVMDTDELFHVIDITISFKNVTTFSFIGVDEEDAAPLLTYTPIVQENDIYTFHCEYSHVQHRWVCWPVKEAGGKTDAVMRDEVGAANGVAPLNANGKISTGYIPYNNTYGTGQHSGYITVVGASTSDIAARTHGYKPITPMTINYAVSAALTDANKISLTDEQKASAQDTLGVGAAPIVFTTAGDAPTTSTVGTPGRRAVNTADGKVWTCTAVNVDDTDPQNPVTTYKWRDDINEIGGKFYNNITFGQFKGISYGVRGGYYEKNLTIGYNAAPYSGDGASIVVGAYSHVGFGDSAVFGRNNVIVDAPLVAAKGTSTVASNAMESLRNGDLYIAGGHQQGVTTIPSATTAYALTEGVQSHTPSAASTYTLPAVPMRVIADGKYFTRNPSTDGTGYYGWLSGTDNRYTASATPSVGDNTYTNTTLTSGAKAITAIDTRTHEIVLDVDFSTVQTFSFEDSDGNTLSLQKDITVLAGDKWRFICIYQYGMWLIYPLQLRVETVTPTSPVSISGDTTTAISVQLSATASGNGILTYTATNLPDGVTCSSSGLISGTPTTAGAYEATVMVRTPYSKPATITVSFTITAPVPSLSISPSSYTVSGNVDSAITSLDLGSNVTVTNPSQGVSPQYSADALPSGLSMSADGVISGTPTASGTTITTVTISYTGAQSITATIEFTVGEASVPETVWIKGSVASGGYEPASGEYTLTQTLNNGRHVWYCSSRGKYLFAVEDEGWGSRYAWVTGPSVATGTGGMDIMHVYSIYSTEYTMENLPSTPVGLTYQDMNEQYSQSQYAVTDVSPIGGDGGLTAPASVTVGGTEAAAAGFAGTYAKQSTLYNNRASYYCTDNGKYLWAVESGMNEWSFAWVFGTSPQEKANTDIVMMYDYHSDESSSLVNSPVGLTYWNGMNGQFSSSEWSVTE